MWQSWDPCLITLYVYVSKKTIENEKYMIQWINNKSFPFILIFWQHAISVQYAHAKAAWYLKAEGFLQGWKWLTLGREVFRWLVPRCGLSQFLIDWRSPVTLLLYLPSPPCVWHEGMAEITVRDDIDIPSSWKCLTKTRNRAMMICS